MAHRHKSRLAVWGGLAALLMWRPAAAQVVNLALGSQWMASCATLPGWDGLVDGVKDSDEPPGCWATDNSAEFPKRVVIDLGGLCQVSRVVVHNSTNGNTKQIQVAVSEDGAKYDLLREYVFPPGRYQPLVHSFTPRNARYVRIVFLNTWGGGIGGDNIMYLREVEVFGKRLYKRPEGLERLWQALAGERAFRFIPGWPAVRRYLRELGRAVRLAVLCPAEQAEQVVGPDGWLSLGLKLLEEKAGEQAWLGQSAEVRVFELDAAEKLADEWESFYGEQVPDVVVVVPGGMKAEQCADALNVLKRAQRDGASVMVCLPLPGQAADEERYRQLRRSWMVVAGQLEAGVLDMAAVIAHRYAWKDFQRQGGTLTADQRSLLAEAWARAVR